ncbi:MAG TPA: DnaB-like helicase N-terminal domain-containing protein, partial [Fibrobacteraceae bacterium]|nr:DnaB-like helicase N-terminal domain-containing protein [Fibrobacteraceae bacterium]
MSDFTIEPPQSLEAETHLLGGLLQDNEKLTDCLALLRAEDFYWEKHQLIFQAMIKLDRERSPIDVVTLAEALNTEENLQKVGGR